MVKILIKYGLVTISSYIFLLLSIYLLVDILMLSDNISYLIMTTLIYAGVYIANIKYVFKVKNKKIRITKYLVYLLIFWTLNNLLFNYFVELLRIQYLLAAIMNIFLFGLIRFYIQKKYVFNE